MSLLKFFKAAGSGIPSCSLFDANARSTSSAFYQLANSGNGSYSRIASTPTFTWKNSGLVSDYQVRATLTGGSGPSGDPTGSWLSLAMTRTWSNGEDETDLFLEIRAVANPSVIITSATVTISFF